MNWNKICMVFLLVLTISLSTVLIAAAEIAVLDYHGSIGSVSIEKVVVDMTFRIYEQQAGKPLLSAPVWIEKQAVTVENGVFDATIGSEIGLLKFEKGIDYYLGVQYDVNSEVLPRELIDKGKVRSLEKERSVERTVRPPLTLVGSDGINLATGDGRLVIGIAEGGVKNNMLDRQGIDAAMINRKGLDADLLDGMDSTDIIRKSVSTRHPISVLPYIIDQTGSYYLVGNLQSVGDGILVDADNVTIDLMGYSISGDSSNKNKKKKFFGFGGDHYGIRIRAGKNVEIKNGTVRGFASHGIFEEAAGGFHIISQLRVFENGLSGIWLKGDNNTISGTTVAENGSAGIIAGKGSLIFENNISRNMKDGISAGEGSIVKGNIVGNNGETGIRTSFAVVTGNSVAGNRGRGVSAPGSTVWNNIVSGNGQDGITASGSISGNTAINNRGDGFTISAGSSVIGNMSGFNKENGIRLFGGSMLDLNVSFKNNRSGKGFLPFSACKKCQYGQNVAR